MKTLTGFLLGGLLFITIPTSAQTDTLFKGKCIDYVIAQSGKIWISTSAGLMTYYESEEHKESLADSKDQITAFATDEQGDLWTGTFNGVVSKIKGGIVVSTFTLPAMFNTPQFMVVSIIPDSNELWIGTLEGVVFKYDLFNQSLVSFPIHTPNQKYLLNIFDMAMDAGGNLWVNTQDRLYFLTTAYSGKKQFEFIGSRVVDKPVLAMGSSEFKVWIVTESSGKRTLHKGTLSNAYLDLYSSKVDMPDELQSAQLIDMKVNSKDQMMILSDRGIFVRTASGWNKLEIPVGLGKADIRGFCADGGQIYLATSKGLMVIKAYVLARN